MKRVLISVEGQTEETFVREVLVPHLNPQDIHPTPIILTTSKLKSGRKFKGGVTNYARAKSEIRKLLNDSDAALITTMYDLYGLPDDFPGHGIMDGDVYKKINLIEKEFRNDIDHSKFLPYLQLHEFEALMFVSPNTTSSVLDNLASVKKLQAIKNSFNTPEEINDSPETAPSKRLLDIFPRYQKTLHGPLIILELGLDTVRQQCPHFNQWLMQLETV